MKILSRNIWIVAIGLMAFAPADKSFTGKIVYKIKMTAASGADITDKIPTGKINYYFINEGNYKTLSDKNEPVQLYNSSGNSYYSFWGKSAVHADAGMVVAEEPTTIHVDSTRIILGRKCNIVILQKKDERTIYYYDKTLRVDPSKFMNHNFGDWNNYLEATGGALNLGSRTETAAYVYEMEATKVEGMALSDKDFVMPEGFKVIKAK